MSWSLCRKSAFLALGVIAGFVPVTGHSAAAPVVSIDAEQLEYRRIKIDVYVEVGDTAGFEIWFSDTAIENLQNARLHSTIRVGDTIDLIRTPLAKAYDKCWSDGFPIHRDDFDAPVIAPDVTRWSCSLSGMTPGTDQWIAVIPIDSSGNRHFDNTVVNPVVARTEMLDERTPPPDTRPILFTLLAIVLSSMVLLYFLRQRDFRRGRVRSGLAHIYVAPALIALAVLTFYPIFYGIGLAFTDADQSHLGDEMWIGAANFAEVLKSPGIWRVTFFTFVWAITNVSAHIVFGLLLALALNRKKIVGKVAYRTVLLLPWAIPGYISVLAWNGMLQPDGLLNSILGTDIDFLAGAMSARVMVILVNIWLGVPFMMMSFSGALQGIPTDMFEAARVDGISPWDQFLHLTLPNLKSTLVPVSLLGFIWTFNSFNTIYLMTRGDPAVEFGAPGATDILITYVFKVAFEYGYYGVAAAWSAVIFAMLVGFSWLYLNKTGATEGAA